MFANPTPAPGTIATSVSPARPAPSPTACRSLIVRGLRAARATLGLKAVVLAAVLGGGGAALPAANPPARDVVNLIIDTDMSGDCDDAGAMAVAHALADNGECVILAVVTNRRDLTNASAAAVAVINTYYGRPDIPIGTDKTHPTALQRTSPFTRALRDEFPHRTEPDDLAPDALDIYRRTLAAQPDGSVTICSIGSLANLADLWRHEPDLVRRKVRSLVIMGGAFVSPEKPETNIETHVEPARFVANEWPGEIIWHGNEVGQVLITGAGLKPTPLTNPVRRAYELRPLRLFYGPPSLENGKPSYDQAAVLFAVRGAEPQYWEVVRGGKTTFDAEARTIWTTDPSGNHAYVKIKGDPAPLAAVIEELMAQPPRLAPSTPPVAAQD